LETYTGEYGNLKIFIKNDDFYYEDIGLYTGRYVYKLLPLSEDQFMTPGFYNRHIKIIRENNSIKGLNIVYQDGKEIFLSRNN
jgi:hypothetical protein